MDLFERAKKVIPGGVNSPVRSFGSVDMEPLFFTKAKGNELVDVTGKKYHDYITSWGPMILGHGREDLIEKAKQYLEEGITFGLPTKVEVEMAELFTEATGTDMVRMVNSGTEATMSAIRLARGYTGRQKIIKFEGCYHGHSDSLLVKSGSGTLTYQAPTSLGVPEDFIRHTLVANYNDLDSLRQLFSENPGEIACVIIEPIAGNMGVVVPSREFMQGLAQLTKEEGALLIFDEVITGFRTSYGSIAKDFQITPDLFTFGKIIGGGLPVGALAGRKEIMSILSPLGGVYQAGTLSGNPLAMKMGMDVLRELKEHPEYYDTLEGYAKTLEEGFVKNLEETGIKGKVVRYKSMLCLFFGEFESISSYEDVKKADQKLYQAYFKGMLKEGFIFGPSQFEAIFMSMSLTPEIIQETIAANGRVLRALASK